MSQIRLLFCSSYLREFSEMSTKKAISPSPYEKRDSRVFLMHRSPHPELCNASNLDTVIRTRAQWATEAVLVQDVQASGLWGNRHEVSNYLRHFRLKSGWQWLRCSFSESVIVRYTQERQTAEWQNRKTNKHKAVSRSCVAVRSHERAEAGT